MDGTNGAFKRARGDFLAGGEHEHVANDDVRRKRPDLPPNHVLLFTILNPRYPITTDVMHTITSSIGKVLRIVIFHKRALQAMVEFDSVETATRVKEALDGADIYSGCCTLKIEYAKPQKLNVHRNDSESWDYTIAENGGSYGGSMKHDPYGGYGGQPADHYERSSRGRVSYNEVMPGYLGDLDQPSLSSSPVLMVYDMNPAKANCERLFNLLCLYGNVMRIKFLKSKEGCAMVEMSDSHAVDRCISNLNGAKMLDSLKLSLGYSKQMQVGNFTSKSFELPDGTEGYKDYSNDKRNRFSGPVSSLRNRIQPPGKILHFYNTPLHITENELRHLISEALNGTVAVINVQLFPQRSPDARSSSGLIEFEDVPQAIEAVMFCNHLPIKVEDSKFPFVMKLCFSSVRNINGVPRAGQE